MFASQITTSNSLIKSIDIDGALTAIFNKNSPKWKTMKKLRKSGKITTLSYFGESVWNTIREVKAAICNPAISFLQHLKMFHESDKAIDTVAAAAPIVTKAANTKIEVCTNFYAELNLKCLQHQMTSPIILYGRLFEEERFQYVSFIFGKRAFVMEMATDISDTQQRACETMCALIRISGGLPTVSLFIKISRGNVGHIVAEIDLPNETFTICESIPDDLEIVNLNEMTDLIIASHYLSNQPYARIQEICAQTVFYKQPFLEGLYVNKCVFGHVSPADDDTNACTSQHPIVLVFCDTLTQSNFLWNNKPLTVNAKALMSNFNCQSSTVPYQQLELLSLYAVSNADECGGIRYGDQILYEGPLVVVFD